MATSGTLSSSKYRIDGIDFWIEISWSATQNVSTNKSTVSFTAKAKSTSGTAWRETWNSSYITMGSTRYNIANGTKCYNDTQVASGSFTVSHGNDGTGSFGWNINVNFYTGGAYNSTGSGTVILNTIPRASTVSISPTSVAIGNSATVTVTRKSTSFTHTVEVLYGSTVKKTLGTKVTTGSFTFSPDYATFAPLNTAGTTVACTVRVTTYNGSTLVGTNSCNVTVTIPNNSTTKPTCSIGTPTKADTVVPNDWGIWVQSQSKVTISPTYGYKYSTSAKSYSISGGGYSSTNSTMTTGVLNTSGTNTFTASVTDKRGFTSASSSTSITVVPWSAPTLSNILCQRVSDSTGTHEDDEGIYLKVTGNSSYSSCENKNSATTSIYYRPYGTTTWILAYTDDTANGDFSYVIGDGEDLIFDIEKAYDIDVRVTDTFKTTSYQDILSSAKYTLLLRRGGNGVAMGKASEIDGAFESAFEGRFYNGLYGKKNPTDTTWINILEREIPSISSGKSGSASLLRCTGTLSDAINIFTNPSKTWMRVDGSLGISSFVRSSGNPGVKVQTVFRPSSTMYFRGVGTIDNGSDKTKLCEFVWMTLYPSGQLQIVASETHINMPSNKVIRMSFNTGWQAIT